MRMLVTALLGMVSIVFFIVAVYAGMSLVVVLQGLLQEVKHKQKIRAAQREAELSRIVNEKID